MTDDWQLSVQPARDANGPTIELFVFNPTLNIDKKFVLASGETGNMHGVAKRFAEHCAIKFERKLREAGIEIPGVRLRIAELMGERWSG
jgi:hypothetical protein